MLTVVPFALFGKAEHPPIWKGPLHEPMFLWLVALRAITESYQRPISAPGAKPWRRW
jgi:hypothetical protein